jgi:hypothetical protein
VKWARERWWCSWRGLGWDGWRGRGAYGGLEVVELGAEGGVLVEEVEVALEEGVDVDVDVGGGGHGFGGFCS